jgi:hypothetical protein
LTMGSKKNNSKKRILTGKISDTVVPGGNTSDKIGKSNKDITADLMKMWCK